MNQQLQIVGLVKLAQYIKGFLEKNEDDYSSEDVNFNDILKKSQLENPWFTQENLRYSLNQWANQLTEENINQWLLNYSVSEHPKKVGLILAGNIPMVGFHDIVSVILSGNIPMIKLSSKDQRVLPFLLNLWMKFSDDNIQFEMVERLVDFDAVIATGSNNTARHLEYYFKNYKNIIRKNRTSIAVLNGDETDEELKLLANDIFIYFGLGCRNVTRLFIPKAMKLDVLFENFIEFGDVINHNSYANNYDYNKAIYLLNQEKFWDNNFVMIKEDDKLFSPLSVINFSRYENLEEVKQFISEHEQEIQCIVANPNLGLESEYFGEAQNPSLDTYADNVDTMSFLTKL